MFMWVLAIWQPPMSLAIDRKMRAGGAILMFTAREGEINLDQNPAAMPADGHVVFIGRVRSPLEDQGRVPKEHGGGARDRTRRDN